VAVPVRGKERGREGGWKGEGGSWRRGEFKGGVVGRGGWSEEQGKGEEEGRREE